MRLSLYNLFNDQGTAILARSGWTDLLICGIATESCVCKTAVEHNLTPWVLADAGASPRYRAEVPLAGQDQHCHGWNGSSGA